MKSPIQRFRLREWQSFAVQNEEVYIETLVSDLKLYGFVSVFFFDKKRSEAVRFTKTLSPGGIWPLPPCLSGERPSPAAGIEGRISGLFFSITFHITENDGTTAVRANLRLLLDATFQHPALSAEFNCDFLKAEPLSVNQDAEKLARDAEKPTGLLSVYKNLCRSSGFITYGERVFSLSSGTALGIFREYKVFFPFTAKRAWVTAFGLDKKGQFLAFSLVDIGRVVTKSRENSFWADSGLTSLPPVRITKSDEAGLDWTIQDVEGMVDLNFTVKESARSQYNFFLTKADYEPLFGTFFGVIKDKTGQKIHIHNLSGTLESLYMRL